MAKVVLIPKTKKDSVIFRILEIAKNESERVFLLDHVCKQIGEVVWDSEAKDPGI